MKNDCEETCRNYPEHAPHCKGSDIELAEKHGLCFIKCDTGLVIDCDYAEFQAFADAIREEQREKDAKESAEQEVEIAKLLKDIFGEDG